MVLVQVYLMNKLNIPNKMFCTRIYEDKDFNNYINELDKKKIKVK